MCETNVQQKIKRVINFDDGREIAKEKKRNTQRTIKSIYYKAKTCPRVTLKSY